MPITEQSVTDNKKYKIVFSGEMKSGHDLPSVKTRLAAAFGLNGESIEKLFPGKAVLVKGNLTLNDAQLFKLNFEKSGALCQLLEASLPPLQPVQVPQPKPVHTVHSDDVQPVAPLISATVPAKASPVRANNFTFKPVQKKSNTAKYVVVLASFIAIALLINVGRDRPRSSPIPGATPSSQNQTLSTQSPSRTVGNTGSLSGQHTIIFNDPKHYYSITLPAGYSISNKSTGDRSKITFTYRRNNTVTIIASPMRKVWNAEEEMYKRVNLINEGKAGPFTNFTLERYQLVAISNMDGYELLMRKGTQIAHSFALVSSGQVAFAVAIITEGNESQANHDLLETSVWESLRPN